MDAADEFELTRTITFTVSLRTKTYELVERLSAYPRGRTDTCVKAALFKVRVQDYNRPNQFAVLKIRSQ